MGCRRTGPSCGLCMFVHHKPVLPKRRIMIHELLSNIGSIRLTTYIGKALLITQVFERRYHVVLEIVPFQEKLLFAHRLLLLSCWLIAKNCKTEEKMRKSNHAEKAMKTTTAKPSNLKWVNINQLSCNRENPKKSLLARKRTDFM